MAASPRETGTFHELEASFPAYMQFLEQAEKSFSTLSSYRRTIQTFLDWAGTLPMQKASMISYKQYLQTRYKPSTVNAKLTAIHGFLSFAGHPELRVQAVRIQNQSFCTVSKELTREEYFRLVQTARVSSNEQLALILQTICCTGIRVSELQYITVEAAKEGVAGIHLKGKYRSILLPDGLCLLLQTYADSRQITSGPIFVTRSGRPLDRSNIWKHMKALCAKAGVEESKVYPHNLRHLFARSFYNQDKDLAKLADVLGHSSILTTRIYITTTSAGHRKLLNQMNLLQP